MKRTQIYLDEDMVEFLESESRTKHKSMSEIIRESIKEKMQNKNKDLLKFLNKVSGLWKDYDFDISSYIENVRRDRIK